jgi:hypothetical protein
LPLRWRAKQRRILLFLRVLRASAVVTLYD